MIYRKRKVPRKNKRVEHQIQSGIEAALRLNGCEVYRGNVGLAYTKDGRAFRTGLQEVDGVIIHFIGGSSCKIDRMSVDHLVDFIERQSNKRRELGEDGPNLIRIEGGPFFQLKNVTYVEPWEHTEMVIDMEDKNEK